jgi:hypothetical protein
MQFTNVIFNTYDGLISSDFPDLYLRNSLYKIIYFNRLKFFNFSAIVIISVVCLFLFKGSLNIE